MNKKEAIEYYKQLFSELNSIVCKWDPYGLSDGGRISDEFSEEVALILAGLRYTENCQTVINLVSSVFSKAFSPSEFGQEKCNDIGIIIHNWWETKK